MVVQAHKANPHTHTHKHTHVHTSARTHKRQAAWPEHHEADVESGARLGPLFKALGLHCWLQLICRNANVEGQRVLPSIIRVCVRGACLHTQICV